MSRFWIILSVVIVGLIGLFIVTKPKEGGPTNFSGDPKVIVEDDHVRSERGKRVTLIEYGDFQCPSCGAYYPILKELEATYGEKVTFVFRHFPLRSIHPNAQAAALAAEAASRQGKFFEMHDRLFETQSSWGQVTTNQQKLFEGYATDLGLNMDQFRADYKSEDVANRVNRDLDSGKLFKITGTPSFILNGEKITNPKDLADFKSVLDAAIKKAEGGAN